jgi:hypothetical protein
MASPKSNLRKNNQVRQEIARVFTDPVVLRTCSQDARKLLEHGLATMVRVSQSQDPKYAMEAGRWLVEYAQRALEQQRQPPRPKPVDERVEIIAELRGLYAKALNANPRPLVIDSIELVPDS